MDLPIELVGLLKHAGVDGKKLSWDLQVNSSAISIKLMWIKAAKPVEKTGEITSRAQKKSTSHLPPGEETPNAWNSWRRKGKPWWQQNLCSNTERRLQPLYRWKDANKAAQQWRPSHQHSNSIDKKGSDRHRQDAHILLVCNQHRKKIPVLKIPAKIQAVQLYEVRTTERNTCPQYLSRVGGRKPPTN